jgi:hypothetical protein
VERVTQETIMKVKTTRKPEEGPEEGSVNNVHWTDRKQEIEPKKLFLI